MDGNSIEFGVFLDHNGEKLFESFTACTPHAAAAAAERIVPGSRALAVSRRWNVCGRCTRCQSIVFEDERPQRNNRGELRCFDCC